MRSAAASRPSETLTPDGPPRPIGRPNESSFVARRILREPLAVALAALTGTTRLGGGCTEVYDHGCRPRQRVEQIQVGASREQVPLVLGSPSTTARRSAAVALLHLQHATRPVAFPQSERRRAEGPGDLFRREGPGEEIGNYGLQTAKVPDFISRSDQDHRSDYGLPSQILKATPADPLTGGN